MTYGELLKLLQDFTDEELNQTATVSVDASPMALDEFYPVKLVYTAIDSDVLDPGHRVISISASF